MLIQVSPVISPVQGFFYLPCQGLVYTVRMDFILIRVNPETQVCILRNDDPVFLKKPVDRFVYAAAHLIVPFLIAHDPAKSLLDDRVITVYSSRKPVQDTFFGFRTYFTFPLRQPFYIIRGFRIIIFIPYMLWRVRELFIIFIHLCIMLIDGFRIFLILGNDGWYGEGGSAVLGCKVIRLLYPFRIDRNCVLFPVRFYRLVSHSFFCFPWSGIGSSRLAAIYGGIIPYHIAANSTNTHFLISSNAVNYS